MNEDDIRARVRGQYERFPYPAPKDNLDAFIRSQSCAAGCPAHHFHWFWPYRVATQDLDILVAGCGTQQAVKVAVHAPGARITAIDISASSLQATQRLLDRYGIRNVELRELAIEDVESLGRRFDLIHSTGVIHHLPDPLKGLQALRRVVKESGSLYLMVYGRHGRDGVYLLQELFRRMGLTAENVTGADLAAIRQMLATLPPTHPMACKRGIFGVPEDPSELVDLFLHPQDRAYAIPELLALLGDADLKLQKLLFRGHYLPQYSGLAQSPFFERIMALPEEDRWAVCELYRAAIVMHFFVACPASRAETTYRADLDASGGHSLIPVRNAGVALSREGLPRGKAAWLYWPAHRFPELHLAVSAEEAELFSHMDGKTTVAELLGQSPRLPESQARAFLQSLHDLDYLEWRQAAPVS